eukprot:maker-scaffold230_size244653-snap-gene-0.15 protein:Tk08244 transcript:maker-scaffold230_size244653-snap-gene-0.15-mRNA-1 annotation:"hypothetical protein L798_00576"
MMEEESVPGESEGLQPLSQSPDPEPDGAPPGRPVPPQWPAVPPGPPLIALEVPPGPPLIALEVPPGPPLIALEVPPGPPLIALEVPPGPPLIALEVPPGPPLIALEVPPGPPLIALEVAPPSGLALEPPTDWAEQPATSEIDLEPAHPDEPPTPWETECGQLTAEILVKDENYAHLERELASLKAELHQHQASSESERGQAAQRYRQLQDESGAKIGELKKQFQAANRDKESMVMKYALGESEVIRQRKGKEEAERKLKMALKERDDLSAKAKTLQADKTKVQQLSDSRLQDLWSVKKEVERWQEEVRVQESKACVAGSRLKTEVDAHRETRDQLENTIKHLSETRQEIEKTRQECQTFMDHIRQGEVNKVRLEQSSQREHSAKLIIDAAAATELGSLRVKYHRLIEENNHLSVRIQKLETERLTSDETIGKLKETISSQKQENIGLMAQVAELESLRMQLQKSQEKLDAKVKECEDLRVDVHELNTDMSACRQKEAELLEFTQKLTDKNVTLQSDLAALEAKSSALEAEHSRLVAKISDLETLSSQLTVEVSEERKNRKHETGMLVKKLAERSKQVETLNQETLDAKNEVVVLKRKNAASLRELTKELQISQRQLESLQGASPNGTHSHHEVESSTSSRASSSTSLNNQDQHLSPNASGRSSLVVPSSLPAIPTGHDHTNGSFGSSAYSARKQPIMMPDSHVMVEKIVKLQRNLARKQEKVDFMEEHLSTLLDEVKKKNKIIQGYVMRQEPGAIAPESVDNNKRKMSQTGGIMASLYSSKTSDASMTLELSLEINRKLQAVLEDTLFKNITLKENIDTLGNEIASIAANRPRS